MRQQLEHTECWKNKKKSRERKKKSKTYIHMHTHIAPKSKGTTVELRHLANFSCSIPAQIYTCWWCQHNMQKEEKKRVVSCLFFYFSCYSLMIYLSHKLAGLYKSLPIHAYEDPLCGIIFFFFWAEPKKQKLTTKTLWRLFFFFFLFTFNYHKSNWLIILKNQSMTIIMIEFDIAD